MNLLLLGLGIGIVIGATAMMMNFCALGAVADILFAKDWRRMRAWILAIGTALLITQGLEAADLLSLGATPYPAPVSLAALIVGGVAFGYGMALSGGCINRALVRIGAGSFKSLVVLLMVAVTAAATIRFVPAHDVGPTIAGTLAGIAAAMTANASLGHGLAAFLLGGGLMVFALKDRWFRENTINVAGAVVIGAMVPLAWLLTSWLAATPQAINFARPVGKLLLRLGAGGSLNFATSVILGVPIGSFIVAASTRNLALEIFTERRDLVRNLIGGALMGFGGTIGLGCTFGQGLSGLSTTAIGSVAAIAAMVFGCLWGIRSFEAESVWSGLKLTFSRR